MKVSIGDGNKLCNVTDMKVGQIAKATYQGNNIIVLRTWSGWVNLQDPITTWSVSSQVCFMVEILPKGTSVTLTTEI